MRLINILRLIDILTHLDILDVLPPARFMGPVQNRAGLIFKVRVWLVNWPAQIFLVANANLLCILLLEVEWTTEPWKSETVLTCYTSATREKITF